MYNLPNFAQNYAKYQIDAFKMAGQRFYGVPKWPKFVISGHTDAQSL